MIVSFVVRSVLRFKRGQRVTSMPATSYADALALASALNNGDAGINRSADIGINVPLLQGNSVFIPSSAFSVVQKAIEEAMEDMTKPRVLHEHDDFED